VSWFTRFTHTLRSRRLDDELREEFDDHLARRQEQFQSQGLPADEARRRARQAFGNTTALHERTRDTRVWLALAQTLDDIRYALRGLRRNAVFALTAIGSLTVAIAAITAVYAVTDAALFRPLPVPMPDRLVTLASTDVSIDDAARGGGQTFSYPMFEQLRAAAESSARLTLIDSPSRVEAQTAVPNAPYEEVIRQDVAPNFFQVVGVAPALGRLLTDSDDGARSSRPAVVLSYDYWARRFGQDQGVLGQGIILAGRTYFVVGVAREGFFGVEPGKFVDLWLPVTLGDPGILTNADYRPFHLIGRLAPRASALALAERLQPVYAQAQHDRAAAAGGVPEAIRSHIRDAKILVHGGANGVSAFRDTFSRPLWVLLAIASGLLLVACANVASLLLARATARAPEIALRVSLGAPRGRLMKHLLTESAVIAALASILGSALAYAAAPALVGLVSTRANPIRVHLALDWHLLGFTIGLCWLSTLFFGWLPAWQASGAAPMPALRRSKGQGGRLRLSRMFVGAQIAFAFCLVTAGSAFFFSLRNLATVPTGFDANGVTVLTISNGERQWNRQLAFVQRIQPTVAALPQIQGVSTAWTSLFSGAGRAQRVALPGQPLSVRQQTFYRVSPGHFATLHTPLLQGRDLLVSDNDDEPVATVVNVTFAAQLFGSDDVLGREFVRDDGVRHRVVGLSADSHYADLRGGPEGIAYMPMKPPRAFTMYVRSTLPPAVVAGIVDREGRALEPSARVSNVTTLETLVTETMLQERLLAGLGSVVAVLGLGLASVGLFGLLSYIVVRRTKEFGIRAALGAGRGSLHGLVLKELAGLVGGGLALGILSGLAAVHLARALLFDLAPQDPRIIGTALGVFALATLAAAGLPAVRAGAIDPVVALRDE